MPKKATGRAPRSRVLCYVTEVKAYKKLSNYSDEDINNLLQCYVDSHGKIKKTINLFARRHGIKTTVQMVHEIVSSSINSSQYWESGGDAKGAVTGKEDIEYVSDESNISTDINNLKQENSDLLSDTYVYTTRLDEMHIFNTDFSNLSVKTIEERIIIESKPDKCKIKINNYHRKKGLSAKILIEKIGILNAMIRKQAKSDSVKGANDSARSDMHTKSLELYQLCKPITIPLIDCLKYPLDTTINIENLKKKSLVKRLELYRNMTSQTLLSTGTEIKDELIGSLNSYVPAHLCRTADTDKIDQDMFIVMKNMFSKNTEIYYVPRGSNAPATYDVIDHVIHDDNELSNYVNNTIMELVNCCWYNRQHNIKKISMSRFLIEAHPCGSTLTCTCCCSPIRVQNDISNIPTRRTYWPIQNDNTFMHINELDRNITNAQTVINKALIYYKTHAKENTPTTQTLSPDRIKEPFNITLKTYKETEYYMSGYNYGNDGLKQGKSMFACCWHRRQNIISGLEYSQSTLINEPHGCPAVKCYCCCLPPVPHKLKVKSVPMILPVNSLGNYKSKFIQTAILHRIQSLTTTRPQFTKSTESHDKLVACNPANIQVLHQGPNIRVIANKIFEDPALQDPVVSTIFCNILDKYKNIKLTVNPQGMVRANLNIPLESLSAEDFNLLVDLLEQVQAQVDSLKKLIGPSPAVGLLQDTNVPVFVTGESEHAPSLATANLSHPIVSDAVFSTTVPKCMQKNYNQIKSEQVHFNSSAVDGEELCKAYKYLTQIKTEQYRLSYKAYTQRPSSIPFQSVTPLAQSATPLAQSTTPLAQSATPLAQSATPLAQSATPLAQSATSLAQSATPLAQSATPLAQSATPLAQSATPLAQSATPLAQSATPLAQSATPLAQSATPLAQSATPLIQYVSLLPQSDTPLPQSDTHVTPFPESTPEFQPIIQNVFSLKDLLKPSTSGIKRKTAKKPAPSKKIRVKTPAELAEVTVVPPQNADEPTRHVPEAFNEEYCKFIETLVDSPIANANPNLYHMLPSVPPPLLYYENIERG